MPVTTETAPLYQPCEELSDEPAELTWAELCELLAHWRSMGETVPAELDERADGSVVDVDWSPATDPNPAVWAQRL